MALTLGMGFLLGLALMAGACLVALWVGNTLTDEAHS